MRNYQDTENKILGYLLRNPMESKSMNKIALDTKLSYVTVYKLIPSLLRKRIISSEKKGKANFISINFEEASIDSLSSAMLYEKNKFIAKHPALILLTKEIEESLAGNFYTLLLFGSYAKEKSVKDSDIDLFFIIPRRQDIEYYKERINKALKLHPRIKNDFKLVSAQDFIEMLNQKYTVGLSVFQHGIVLLGVEHYYSMVKSYVRKKGY